MIADYRLQIADCRIMRFYRDSRMPLAGERGEFGADEQAELLARVERLKLFEQGAAAASQVEDRTEMNQRQQVPPEFVFVDENHRADKIASPQKMSRAQWPKTLRAS